MYVYTRTVKLEPRFMTFGSDPWWVAAGEPGLTGYVRSRTSEVTRARSAGTRRARDMRINRESNGSGFGHESAWHYFLFTGGRAVGPWTDEEADAAQVWEASRTFRAWEAEQYRADEEA